MTSCALFLVFPLMGFPLTGFPLLERAPGQDLARPERVDSARTAIPSQELRLELYDVGDLTGFDKLSALGVDAAGLGGSTDGELPGDFLAKLEELKKAREGVQHTAQGLTEILELYMQPAFAPERNQLTLVDAGNLVLLASTEQHTWLDTFLKFQREPQGYLQIEAKMITVPQGTMARLGVTGSAQIFEETEPFDTLLQKLSATQAGVEVITAPKLLTLPFQRATVSLLNQVAYVRDYDLVVVEPGDVELADPVIDVIQEGVVFNVRGVPLSPGIYGVEVDLTQSTLARPIPTFKTVIGAGRHEVSISLPQVTKRGVRTHFTLADGAAAVFVSPDDEDDRDLVVTFRLRQVREGEWDLLQKDSGADEGGK